MSGFRRKLALGDIKGVEVFRVWVDKTPLLEPGCLLQGIPLYSHSLQSSNAFEARTFKLVPPPPLMSLSQTHNAIANSKATVTSFHEKSLCLLALLINCRVFFATRFLADGGVVDVVVVLSICVSCQPMLFMARLILTLTPTQPVANAASDDVLTSSTQLLPVLALKAEIAVVEFKHF